MVDEVTGVYHTLALSIVGIGSNFSTTLKGNELEQVLGNSKNVQVSLVEWGEVMEYRSKQPLKKKFSVCQKYI